MFLSAHPVHGANIQNNFPKTRVAGRSLIYDIAYSWQGGWNKFAESDRYDSKVIEIRHGDDSSPQFRFRIYPMRNKMQWIIGDLLGMGEVNQNGRPPLKKGLL